MATAYNLVRMVNLVSCERARAGRTVSSAWGVLRPTGSRGPSQPLLVTFWAVSRSREWAFWPTQDVATPPTGHF